MINWIQKREKILNNLFSYKMEEYRREIRLALDKNENFFIPFKYLRSLALETIRDCDFRAYPEKETKELLRKISEFQDLREEMLVIGNGSDDLIDRVCRALLFDGGTAAIISPTFSMYRWYVERCGAKPIEMLLNKDFSLNYSEILKRCRRNVNIIFICSPNNPTGNIFKRDEVLKVVEKFKGVIFIDEAYSDFSSKNLLDLVLEYDNVLISRSFSKIGLSGLRIGYLTGSEGLINLIKRFIPPFNVNCFSLRIASKVIENYEEIRRYISEMIRERERMRKELNALSGVFAYRSDANFILIRLAENLSANDVHRQLLDRGIAVRNVSYMPLLSNCLRITVGTHEMNQVLLENLREVIGV